MLQLMFLGGIGLQEILIIAFIVLLLFGGKKIPELMKGLGKGVRSFKDGVNSIEEETKKELESSESTQQKEKQCNHPSMISMLPFGSIWTRFGPSLYESSLLYWLLQ